MGERLARIEVNYKGNWMMQTQRVDMSYKLRSKYIFKRLTGDVTSKR